MDIEKIVAFLQNMNPLTIKPQLCSKKITPKSTCPKCQEICPVQAITLTGNGPQVDGCISCGLCIEICPNHVFRLNEDQLLDIDTNKTETLILTCPQSLQNFGKNPEKGITKISCLGELYPELLLYLMASFSRVIIYYDPQICGNCFNYNFEEKFKLNNLSNIFEKNFLERLLVTTDINKIKPLLNQQKLQPAHNRRSFFRSIFAGSKNISQKIIDYGLNQENSLGSNSKDKPLKMYYLKEALKKQTQLDYSKALPFPNLKLNACNFCQACTKLCPTGALKINQGEEEKAITFSPSLCTHCHICSDICFYQGLTWEGNTTLGDFLGEKPQNLGKAPKKICENCQQEFFELDEKQELCFLCRPLQDLNF